MSWRDIVRKSNCTAKMGTCSCEECLNKGGCPHCDGNAPRSECICGHTAKGAKPDFLDLDGDGNRTESMKEAAKNKVKKMRVRIKPPSDNRCPKCGEEGFRFMGSNPLLCTNPNCSEYNPEQLRRHGMDTYPRMKKAMPPLCANKPCLRPANGTDGYGFCMPCEDDASENRLTDPNSPYTRENMMKRGRSPFTRKD